MKILLESFSDNTTFIFPIKIKVDSKISEAQPPRQLSSEGLTMRKCENISSFTNARLIWCDNCRKEFIKCLISIRTLDVTM